MSGKTETAPTHGKSEGNGSGNGSTDIAAEIAALRAENEKLRAEAAKPRGKRAESAEATTEAIAAVRAAVVEAGLTVEDHVSESQPNGYFGVRHATSGKVAAYVSGKTGLTVEATGRKLATDDAVSLVLLAAGIAPAA